MLTDRALWDRLDALSLDDMDAEFPFSARLARDNGWSRAFAARVCEEYKRFVYLAIVADHQVTPSDEVDQAWHLHMTYTRHYWGPFKEVLGRALHHGPTAGGARERVRYQDNYAKTLASYAREFDAPPPRAIWPAAKIRFGDAPFMRRVNTRRSLVVDKLRLVKAGAAGAGVAALAGMIGAAAAQSESGEPSFINDLAAENGLVFLFVVLCLFGLFLSWFSAMSASDNEGASADDLSDNEGVGFTIFGISLSGLFSGDSDGDSGCSGCGGCGD